MNGLVRISIVVLLLAAVVLVVLETTGMGFGARNGEEAASADFEGKRAEESSSRAKSDGRARKTAVPPFRQLRDLLEAGIEDAPKFTTVERLVGRLTDEELVALRSESSSARPDSVGGWVRCAVFAELARRDSQAAFAWLHRDEGVREMDFWGMRQAWFSTYRGWAEVDAVAAAENLLKFLGPRNYAAHFTKSLKNLSFESYELLIRQDDVWKRQAVEAVFAQFARVDAVAAWKTVPAFGPAGHRTRALAGFFRGMEGHPDLPTYLAQWEPAQLGFTPGALDQALANPDGPRYASAPGAEWALASEVASSVVWTDEGDAREWLRGLAGYLGEEKLDDAIAGYQAMELTRRDPGKAIAQAADGARFGGNYVALMARHHPERVPELIKALEDHDPAQWWGQFAAAIFTQSRLEQADLFPAPGRMNRLPNFEERYAWLLEAVSAGELDGTIKAKLLEQVHKTFSEAVPAAKDASPGRFR